MLPLALVLGLVLLVGLAAARGGNGSDGDRAVAAITSTATTDAATNSDRTPLPSEPADETPTADAETSDRDDDSTPVTPAPTEVLGRSIEQLPLSGPGTYTATSLPGMTYGVNPRLTFTVATEDGSGVNPDDVAALVDDVLSDPRSWIGDGVTGLQRVAPDESPDFTLVVATPATVDQLCAPLQTNGRYSCGRNGWIALNLLRWETGAEEWPSTLEIYRQYLINHEIGHYLWGPDHDNVCPEPGGLAPIMMQQSISLNGCEPNGWVFPDG